MFNQALTDTCATARPSRLRHSRVAAANVIDRFTLRISPAFVGKAAMKSAAD